MIQQLVQPETTTSFGYWVRRQRLALDLTQAELARLVNCAKVTITKIEHDERRPSRQMANLLADHLAIPTDERARFVATALGLQATDHLQLAAASLASLSPGLPLSNLPASTTPFVGRRAELQQLTARLQDPACRLLTLLGAGGFGKTRLALRLGEIALGQQGQFADGVYFVALDGLEHANLVVPAIAAALDLTFYDQQSQEAQLLAYLGNKHMLLILDNAEQILDAALVDRILVRTPAVKIVVTTRQALQLQQEWTYPIRGMRVEVEIEDAGTTSGEGSDALSLFEQCAMRARPDFELARELAHVQNICRLVDGAPLAIVLAAGWLKALPAGQIARELEHDVGILASAHRNVPDRHRSMRAVLEQSWRYLSDDEQAVFCRLCVFEGGFTLEAARTIVGATLSVLSSLVDKSVLELGQEGRYRIHALLRQFGIQKLEENDEESLQSRARHAEYFLNLLADRGVAITGPDQREVLREIQDDFDNVRTAWLTFADQGELLKLSAAMPCLFQFLYLLGRYEEGEVLASRVRVSVEPASTAEHQALINLIAYHAQFAALLGDYSVAFSEIQSALRDSTHYQFLPEQALCYYVLGIIHIQLDNEADAEDSLWHAYHIFRTLNDSLRIAETALRLGFVKLIMKAEPNACTDLIEESLTLFRALGDTSSIADVLNHTGALRLATGDFDAAEAAYRQSVELAQAVGARFVAAQAIGGLAFVAWGRAHWDLAILLAQQRLEMMQSLGHKNQTLFSLNSLCGIYAHSERYDDALSLLASYPDMWRTGIVAQAQIGGGAYAEAMRYLPQETEQRLAAGQLQDLAVLLCAWVELLTSDCDLLCLVDPAHLCTMTRSERNALAFTTLLTLRASPKVDPMTRQQVIRLLERPRVKLLGSSLGDDPDLLALHTVSDIAQTMLGIRLP